MLVAAHSSAVESFVSRPMLVVAGWRKTDPGTSSAPDFILDCKDKSVRRLCRFVVTAKPTSLASTSSIKHAALDVWKLPQSIRQVITRSHILPIISSLWSSKVN